MNVTVEISKEAILKAINFALFLQKITPKFVWKHKTLFLCIWGMPSLIYGFYLGHKYY
jgi:hypothetical protein